MNKVRQLMDQRGMNVSNLMFASGLSWPTCDDAYKSDPWPTERTQWRTIEAIARALKVDPSELLSTNNNG